MQLPDYTNCGTNLIASILKYFDLKGAHQTLQAVDEMLIKGRYKNIILMLFDGMSMAALDRHLPPDSFLKKHCLSKLSAVFPSTTTAATTSIITGLNPGEHCWIGWTLYFKSLEKSIDLFWNTIQFTKEPAANYSVASSFFPYISATTLITQSGKAQGVTISPFEGHVIHDLDSLFSAVRQHLREAGSHYIYVYWPAPDNHMHQHGCDHEIVKESIINIEKALLEMKSHLGRDDLLLVTADHGLINSKPDFFEDYPLLENMLKIAPAVEPRAAALYVKKEHHAVFPSAFYEAFGDHYLLLTKEEALSSGLFGPDAYREELSDLIGDFFAVAVKEYAIYQKHTHCHLIGMHAGLTEAEMNVPLIAIRGI